MIIKEAIGKGATVELAREDAIAQLNAALDEDVQFEVVAFPKKKVLGLFGGSDAEVRAYVEGPDPAPKKEKPQKGENRNNKKNYRREKPAAKKADKPEAKPQAAPALRTQEYYERRPCPDLVADAARLLEALLLEA